MLQQISWGGLTALTLLIGSIPVYSQPRLADTPTVPSLIAPSLIAQSTVSDKDLQKFANVFKRLRTIEKEVKPKVDSVVKQSGIPPSRFQAIVLSKRDPSQKLSPPLTPDEDKKFMQAANKLKPLFTEVQTKSKKAVTDSGLTLQQFQTIGKAVENDPKLKGKVQALLK